MPYPLSPAQFDSLSDPEQRDFLSKQDQLSAAMRNRLEAVAHISGKSAHDVQMAISDIFADLESAQDKLRPMTLAYDKAIREWKMGKKPYSSSFGRDFAASLVRWEKLRLGIGCQKMSDEGALTQSIGVTYASLSKIEQRAADMVRGERRVARGKSLKDPASRIAKAVRAKWLTPTPRLRVDEPPVLLIKTIVEIALPHIEKLAGGPISGGTPKGNPATTDPPGLGALASIVQMAHPVDPAHPSVGFEYISDLIRSLHKAEV
jgi:hypothetical protein